MFLFVYFLFLEVWELSRCRIYLGMFVWFCLLFLVVYLDLWHYIWLGMFFLFYLLFLVVYWCYLHRYLFSVVFLIEFDFLLFIHLIFEHVCAYPWVRLINLHLFVLHIEHSLYSDISFMIQYIFSFIISPRWNFSISFRICWYFFIFDFKWPFFVKRFDRISFLSIYESPYKIVTYGDSVVNYFIYKLNFLYILKWFLFVFQISKNLCNNN